MARVVPVDVVAQLVADLRGSGRTVIGPTVRDGTIVPDEIESIDDLPRGWADEQAPGSYRVVETGANELFASSSPSDSWKRYLSPPEVLLIRSRSMGGQLDIESAPIEAPSLAFFGIRSCDLAALAVLDRVMAAPGRSDPTYAARRERLFVVAAACSNPGNTCFCVSMGTGPSPAAGFDLSITEFAHGPCHEFLIAAGSPAGEVVLGRLDGRPVTDADEQARQRQHARAETRMGRHLDPADPPVAAAAPTHARWAEIGERCLACGNCTMVCPTCFCNRTTDRTDLVGDQAERWRVWDSCFGADFSSLHGTPVRAATSDRYRQWLLHKLVTWHDQFGTSGCVGCGRCISACPVGIDLTAEVKALAT